MKPKPTEEINMLLKHKLTITIIAVMLISALFFLLNPKKIIEHKQIIYNKQDIIDFQEFVQKNNKRDIKLTLEICPEVKENWWIRIAVAPDFKENSKEYGNLYLSENIDALSQFIEHTCKKSNVTDQDIKNLLHYCPHAYHNIKQVFQDICDNSYLTKDYQYESYRFLYHCPYNSYTFGLYAKYHQQHACGEKVTVYTVEEGAYHIAKFPSPYYQNETIYCTRCAE